MKPAGNFLFRAFSLLAGAFQRGPLAVFEFLLPADAFALRFLPCAFPRGPVFLQPSPIPLGTFLSYPLSFLAGALLQRLSQFLAGRPFLLSGLLTMGDALALGRVLLFSPGDALLLLPGALLRCPLLLLPGALLRCPLLFLPGAFLFLPDSFLFQPGAFLGRALLLRGLFLLVPGAFLGGRAVFLLPGDFRCGAFLGCLTFALPRGAFFCGAFMPGAAFIASPLTQPSPLLAPAFAGGLWLCRTTGLYRAIRFRALRMRAGDCTGFGQARQRCRIELRVLVGQAPLLAPR